jgi:hypothetical protein
VGLRSTHWLRDLAAADIQVEEAENRAMVDRPPNRALQQLIDQSGVSRNWLALRINQLTAGSARPGRYAHTSVTNWIERGMRPRAEIVDALAQALGERLDRPVTAAELGMATAAGDRDSRGLDFPRDPTDAVRGATEFWSTVDRRNFLSVGFAAGATQLSLTRWLAKPGDDDVPRFAGRRIGEGDVAEIWAAAEDARAWDSRFGGDDWRTSAVAQCLTDRAAPMLRGTYSSSVGRELFAAAAELARVAGWAAVDADEHGVAQRHLTQALRLARAAGDVQAGAYVLSTLSLQTYLAGHARQAAEMAAAAYDRARDVAAPRVLAFAKSAEAHAHGLAGDARAADAALSEAMRQLERVVPDGDPAWLAYFTHARIASDAVEINRDLHRPKVALRWAREADAMPKDRFTRSVGIRTAVETSTHLQAGDLDQGLATGHRAVDILARVHSPRAHTYIGAIVTDLAPWSAEKNVADFVHRARTEVQLQPAV